MSTPHISLHTQLKVQAVQYSIQDHYINFTVNTDAIQKPTYDSIIHCRNLRWSSIIASNTVISNHCSFPRLESGMLSCLPICTSNKGYNTVWHIQQRNNTEIISSDSSCLSRYGQHLFQSRGTDTRCAYLCVATNNHQPLSSSTDVTHIKYHLNTHPCHNLSDFVRRGWPLYDGCITIKYLEMVQLQCWPRTTVQNTKPNETRLILHPYVKRQLTAVLQNVHTWAYIHIISFQGCPSSTGMLNTTL